MYIVDITEAILSSTWGRNGSTYPASFSIDRNWKTFCLSKKKSPGSYLDITLDGPTLVEKVQIFNRIIRDDLSASIDGAEVTLWSGGSQVKSCGTVTYISVDTHLSQVYLIDCAADQQADTVRIQVVNQSRVNIAEVYVVTKTAPQNSAQCSVVAGNMKLCNMPFLWGLGDGDIITFTILMFYGTAGNFQIDLLDENNNELLHMKYRSTEGEYVLNNRQDGVWGTEITKSESLFENIILEVKLKLSLTTLEVVAGDVTLPTFVPERDPKLVKQLRFTAVKDDTTLSSVVLKEKERGKSLI